MPKLFFIAVLLTGFFIQIAPPELLAAPSLQMTAQAAFGGRFKNGEWLPVFVNVENSGSDLAGEIRVSITNQTGRLDFAVPAELPAGARKRFTLYILPNNFSRSAKVEFVSKASPTSGKAKPKEEVLLTQTVKLAVIPNDRYVIGAVMANSAGLGVLSPPQLKGRRERADLIGLSLLEIPDRHEGLRILNALILNDVATSGLSPAQHTALSRWVAEGGRLVIGGGAGAARTLAGLPVDLQPVSLVNQQEVSALPGLEAYTGQAIRVPGPFLLAQAQPVPGATILLDQAATETAASPDRLPLIIELPLGAGYVNFIALDLSQSPFDAWAGVVDFAEQLLSPGAAWPEFFAVDIAPQQLNDSQMYYPLTNLPALDLPSIRFLGLLLAGYIILVGPVNYFFLRWRDRMAWAWVTIPVLTLTFASLAYGLGFSLRGSDIIVNQISVTEMDANGQAARVHTYVGLFSPRRQTYDIEVAANSLLRPLGQGGYDPWSSVPNNSGMMKVIQGQPAHIQGLAVDQWSMQSFVAETTSNEMPGLVARLTATRDSLEGSVVNQSNLTWQDVIIVFSAQFQKLGDLAPGQEAEIHLDFHDSNLINGFGSYMLYQDEFNGPTGPSREVTFKQSVLDNTVFSGNRLDLSEGPFLIAWQENNSPLEIRLEGYHINSQETTFLYSPLALNFDEAQVAVPPGFSRVEILSVTGDASSCNYGAGLDGTYIYQGKAEVKVSLPSNVRQTQPHRLDLYLRTDGSWSTLPTIELYDQTHQTWVPLEDVKTGSNPINNVAHFYNQAEAAMQVRISNNGVNGGCLFLELALEGKRL